MLNHDCDVPSDFTKGDIAGETLAKPAQQIVFSHGGCVGKQAVVDLRAMLSPPQVWVKTTGLRRLLGWLGEGAARMCWG